MLYYIFKIKINHIYIIYLIELATMTWVGRTKSINFKFTVQDTVSIYLKLFTYVYILARMWIDYPLVN